MFLCETHIQIESSGMSEILLIYSHARKTSSVAWRKVCPPPPSSQTTYAVLHVTSFFCWTHVFEWCVVWWRSNNMQSMWIGVESLLLIFVLYIGEHLDLALWCHKMHCANDGWESALLTFLEMESTLLYSCWVGPLGLALLEWHAHTSSYRTRQWTLISWTPSSQDPTLYIKDTYLNIY